MTTTISDYILVGEKITALGCNYPHRLTLLPTNFDSALTIKDFRQQAEAPTVKKLIRLAGLPYDEITSKEQSPPYIQNNGFEWVCPIIFVSSACTSNNPEYISIALKAIYDYLIDISSEILTKSNIKINVIVEETKTKKCKKISYDGDVDGLKSFEIIVKDVCNGK